jgi:hypothetical protein
LVSFFCYCGNTICGFSPRPKQWSSHMFGCLHSVSYHPVRQSGADPPPLILIQHADPFQAHMERKTAMWVAAMSKELSLPSGLPKVVCSQSAQPLQVVAAVPVVCHISSPWTECASDPRGQIPLGDRERIVLDEARSGRQIQTGFELSPRLTFRIIYPTLHR